MKTPLQSALCAVAPNIAISTHWEHDPCPDMEIFEPGNALEGEDPDAWQCWQSEIRASVIVAGQLATGSGYMGGTWHKFGEDPASVNPDISGYERQMTEEALKELPLVPGIADALNFIYEQE